MGDVEEHAEQATVAGAQAGPVETIALAIKALDREAGRLETLRRSDGAEAMAGLLRALEAEWEGALKDGGPTSPAVERAATTARAFLRVYPRWLG